MARPLVTTIIPVYNRAGMLREAVASVLAQTYRPIEVLIVDDGSTDETRETAEELAASDPAIRLVRQSNSGPGAAREAARLQAEGAFIQHLDSDDLLLPQKFELQVAALERDASAGAAYGWTRRRFPDGSVHPAPWKRSGERIETMFPAMLMSRWWDTATPLYRRTVIDRAGAWLPLWAEEDWEYDCRIAAAGTRLAYVADWVCEYRAHSAGHLSGRGGDPRILRDRAEAHERIYAHARAAGIDPSSVEMQHFARELFLLARQCGAAGLADASMRLFRLAREASGEAGRRLQFRLYEAVANSIGWTAAGRIACITDRLRW
ncbi:MAG TPA: glycosyltransferase family A protein [Thermoanaerobaculia bacterium]|nr:glycosyltransferase family A protein [Thermoanaerobaculia bacterium]